MQISSKLFPSLKCKKIDVGTTVLGVAAATMISIGSYSLGMRSAEKDKYTPVCLTEKEGNAQNKDNNLIASIQNKLAENPNMTKWLNCVSFAMLGTIIGDAARRQH